MAYTPIDKSSDYFNTVLYTGNGGTQTISGVGFEPDWTWIKVRSTSDNHSLEDQVRGANKTLKSDTTGAEFSSGTVQISSWNSDGFALGSADGQTNGNGQTYASWNWKAETSFSNSAGANGATIASTGSVNQDAGFSIVSYTGSGSNATVCHGLGSTPKILIVKNRDATENWLVYSSKLTGTSYIRLNLSDAKGTASAVWNNTDPTSSVFTVGIDGAVNANGNNIIAYCFAEKQGYSKFGSYVGNGNTDGPFVYTGFKPAFVICKITSGTDQWVLYDNKRDTFNVTEQILRPNISGAEGTESGAKMDLLSNGFKLRGSGGGIGQTNNSGGSYIYMAFAENPFVTSTGIPATAR